MKPLALFAIATFFSAMVFAGTPKPSALEAYQLSTAFTMEMCKLTFATARNRAKAAEYGASTPDDANSDYKGCIAKSRTYVKKDFTAAVAAAKKARLKEALRAYQVAYLTALAGIEPGFDERTISYEQRQQALNDKMNEAWAKVEVEN